MRHDAPALPQAILLGAMFVVVAVCSDLCYVMFAAWLARRWRSSGARAGAGARRAGAWGRYASGTALIALGVASAFTGQRSAR
jgi:threonine/homoserine/homoserine lactone efflux protein